MIEQRLRVKRLAIGLLLTTLSIVAITVLMLVKASSQLCARYAVQAINANMRISVSQLGQDLPVHDGTLSVPVLRLKQNKRPKIVLQVLLGTMAACGAIAYSMMSTKELLR